MATPALGQVLKLLSFFSDLTVAALQAVVGSGILGDLRDAARSAKPLKKNRPAVRKALGLPEEKGARVELWLK